MTRFREVEADADASNRHVSRDGRDTEASSSALGTSANSLECGIDL